ncbi:MAG: bifunctional isocitrate dehydrogenase kinase/phosphatase [Rhodospirillales bacterium]|nr:bifunctional isocitrate dehydrogenase kinase/phosphatase [Rhodospirillales bacterium]
MNESSTIRSPRKPGQVKDHLGLIARAETNAERCRLTAELILARFDAYYLESRHIPKLAKQAFEARDPGRSLELSHRRLSLYSESIATLGAELAEAFPLLAEQEPVWAEVEQAYLPLIEGRYEADLAFAFIHSVRRKIHHGEWQPVAYDFGTSGGTTPATTIQRDFPGGARLTPETVAEILAVPEFSVPYRDLEGDAARVAERVNAVLGLDGRLPEAIGAVEMIAAGFYRNRGVYLLGRIVMGASSLVPFVLSLENDAAGIYVDAVLTSEADTHNIFSSTLANFHVTSPYYHELAAFLHSIMPTRPLGLHYSTIGFNHVGKVAVMNELKAELTATRQVFETAVGFRGTVAIGFSAPATAYVLKVIRNEPTAQYKWGAFEGRESVLRKYGRVHEINRTGSMLDNIIYTNLKLDKYWFSAALLEEILAEASDSVSLQGRDVIFKQLIVQRRMTPLPVFLETASRAEAEVAVINLGHCIKNNAAANIFNKDLDGRNYGVSKYLKVYLYDYDALEPFTEVKIRTNLDRVDGEEDVPDWFFEEGFVFLPEEIEAGLRIHDRSLRRVFREVHGDLLTTDYWDALQRDLRAGKVPRISVYPEARKLAREAG